MPSLLKIYYYGGECDDGVGKGGEVGDYLCLSYIIKIGIGCICSIGISRGNLYWHDACDFASIISRYGLAFISGILCIIISLLDIGLILSAAAALALGCLNIKCRLTSLGIPIMKKRRSHDHFIFIIKNSIPRKAVFILRWATGSWSSQKQYSASCVSDYLATPNLKCNENSSNTVRHTSIIHAIVKDVGGPSIYIYQFLSWGPVYGKQTHGTASGPIYKRSNLQHSMYKW